jgi:gamma-glutamyl hercynylcysteine S-oxide hydrolase
VTDVCRHLVWLGRERSLGSVVLDPEWSLQRQAYEPRLQLHGTMNVDGYGIAWYQKRLRAEPAQYRRAVPIWGDASLPTFAPLVRSTAILASLRSSMIGQPVQESDTAPFVRGRWAFSFNGAVSLDALSPLIEHHPAFVNPCDATVLAAVVFDRVIRGDAPEQVLAEVVAHCAAKDPEARLNLILTNGVSVCATTFGASLHYLHDRGLAEGGVLVSSEPLDDDPRWVEVPDRSLILADPGSVARQELVS